MKIDLFLLHDDKLDNSPRKCLVASGKHLKIEIGKYIDYLISQGWTKQKLTFHFMKILNFSECTCNRLIYLRHDYFHLVFLKELLILSNAYEDRFHLQKKITCLKACQPPLKVYKAAKTLTLNLCKIAGAHAADGTVRNNYFSINDGHKSNLRAFANWFYLIFSIQPPVKTISEKEWKVSFNSKVFFRYLTKIFSFPNGYKTDSVCVPKIIKESSRRMQIAFAKGFMTFESGVGIKNEVEFCVFSKNIVTDLATIFKDARVKFTKMQGRSGKYWRIWSGKINQKEAKKWLQFYENETYKYNRLKDYAFGYKNKASTFEQAIQILNYAFPKKPNNKTSLEELVKAVQKIKLGTRHDIKKAANLENFGGPWNGSLKPYLSILEQTKIITTKIGKANGKSCQIYIYNPNVEEWSLPSAKIE